MYIEQMNFEAPVKLTDGRYFVKITNEDKTRVFKQINGVEVAAPGCYKVTKTDLSEYDDAIIAKATESSELWFGKVVPEETLKNLYESSITDDVFEASLMKIKGKTVTVLFDSNKKEISLDQLTTGVKCNLFVELSGIWFLKKNFGPIWRVAQARIVESQKSSVTKSYMFTDEETQEDESDELSDFV